MGDCESETFLSSLPSISLVNVAVCDIAFTFAFAIARCEWTLSVASENLITKQKNTLLQY